MGVLWLSKPGKRKRSKMAATSGAAKGKGQLTQEQVIQQFNQMRQELTSILSKVHELEMDQNEHRLEFIQ